MPSETLFHLHQPGEYLEPPVGYMVSNNEKDKKDIQRGIENMQTRAFLVTEDGDIVIGKTPFHKDITTGRSREFKVLDKGTIVPKSEKINFIYSDNFKSALSREDRLAEQQKVRDSINSFLEIKYS